MLEGLLEVLVLLLELADLAEHLLDVLLELLGVHLHVLQEEDRGVLAAAHERMQEVLRAHVRVAELVRGDDTLFDHGVQERREAVLRLLPLDVGGAARLQQDADVLLRHPRPREDREPQRLGDRQQAQQQVLGADVAALHILRLLLGELEGELGIRRESIERVHGGVGNSLL